MNKHTPTPWHIRDVDTYTIRSQHGCEVARAARHHIPADEIKANAAFIVRAVNAHDALVEALTKAQGHIKCSLNGWFAPYADCRCPACDGGRLVIAALKLARGDK